MPVPHGRPGPKRWRRHSKKPLVVVGSAELGVDVAPRIQTLKVAEPARRSAGIKVPDVAALVARLKNEEKVI